MTHSQKLALRTLPMILTLAFAAAASAAPRKTPVKPSPPVVVKPKILVVASSAEWLDLKRGKGVPTGYYLSELAVPAQKFVAAGYDIVIATPSGKTPAVDKGSVKVGFFGNDEEKFAAAQSFVATLPSMQNPISLKDAASRAKEFAAVYVPGGHAPMMDLMQDPDLGTILRELVAANKPTAFLCHGPIATLAALPNAPQFRKALVMGDDSAKKEAGKGWLYAGYRMTVFANSEERIAEINSLKGSVPFYVADALSAAGGKVENGETFKSFVVVDRQLITGQNPASDAALADAVLKALVAQQIK